MLTAARLGADAVEIDARGEISPRDFSDTALRQLRKMLADQQVRVAAIGFATRRGYNVLEDLDRRVAATKEALEFAYRLGASVVVNAVGRIPESATGPEWDLLVQTLTDIGAHGDRVGARLATRTGSESPETLHKLLSALPDGALAIDFDPASLVINGHSPTEAVRLLGRHVGHVHARDGVRDLALRRGLEVTLGRGSVDFPALLGELEQREYTGYLTIERTTAEDAVKEFGDAVAYLRSLEVGGRR